MAKNDFKMAAVSPFGLEMFTFCHMLSSSIKYVHQISSQSDDFASRYGNLTIFKIVDLRHLEFYWSNNGFFEKPM